MKTALIIITSILTFAVVVLAITANALSGQVAHLRGEHQSDRRVMGELQNEVDNLGSQISSLNQPSDPLSAYNQICQNPNVMNNQTGVTQTYYYPCTNAIIPTTGNLFLPERSN